MKESLKRQVAKLSFLSVWVLFAEGMEANLAKSTLGNGFFFKVLLISKVR